MNSIYSSSIRAKKSISILAIHFLKYTLSKNSSFCSLLHLNILFILLFGIVQVEKREIKNLLKEIKKKKIEGTYLAKVTITQHFC